MDVNLPPEVRAELLRRTAAVLGHRRRVGGTRLATAVADALAVDLAQAASPTSVLGSLTEDGIHRTSMALTHALYGFPVCHAMPGGSLLEATTPSNGFSVAGRPMLIVAGTNGLHDAVAVQEDAGGPNLDRLHRLILGGTRGLACRRLGLPDPAPFAVAGARASLRFPPSDDAGSAILQLDASDIGGSPFRSADPKAMRRFAETATRDMREFWSERAAIGAIAEETRGWAAALLAGRGTEAAAIRLDTVAAILRNGASPLLRLSFRSLDDALRPGLSHATTSHEVEASRISAVVERHRVRAEAAARLQGVGADGRIDDVAAALVSATPDGGRSILQTLGRELEARMELKTASGTMYCRLFWLEGVIRAEAVLPGLLHWRGYLRILAIGLPETMLGASPGRRLSEIVGPPIGCAARIIDAAGRDGHWIDLAVDLGISLVDTASARIWGRRGGRRAVRPGLLDGY